MSVACRCPHALHMLLYQPQTGGSAHCADIWPPASAALAGRPVAGALPQQSRVVRRPAGAVWSHPEPAAASQPSYSCRCSRTQVDHSRFTRLTPLGPRCAAGRPFRPSASPSVALPAAQSSRSGPQAPQRPACQVSAAGDAGKARHCAAPWPTSPLVFGRLRFRAPPFLCPAASRFEAWGARSSRAQGLFSDGIYPQPPGCRTHPKKRPSYWNF